MPNITVAPNGARLQKSDHDALPITPQELADTARECYAAGASAIHLHVRSADNAHSLDPALYRTAIAAVTHAAPHLAIQVTTEAAGRFSVAEQLHLLEDLKPAAASISIREIARSPELALSVYQTAQRHGTQVQHILYGSSCIEQLSQWFASGVVPTTMCDAIVVLGQYAPPRAGNPLELTSLLRATSDLDLRVTVCAFGADEQACLCEASRLGCDVRVGFENNLRAPNGLEWDTNAEAVRALKLELDRQQEGSLR